ncbi:MAG: aminoglycoside phosphotransferase family protein [Candidatus Nanoarchaeia archaeon]|nr:aminoglycoside phosphotransferase family protein [Candidatus Nanoarchaeia archaeon]
MAEDETKQRKLLEKIVKEILKVTEIKNIKILNEGYSNDVYEVKTEKGDFILRIKPKNNKETFEKTVNAMRFVENEIPNKIIKLSEDKKIMITDKIEGNSLQSQLDNLTNDEIFSILKKAFQSSIMMSNKKVVKGFGYLNENLQGWANSAMEEVFFSLSECLHSVVSKKYIDIEITKKIGNLFYNNIELFLNVEPRFVYCDLHFGNIIIENKKFKSVIDFESCYSGDPVRMFQSLFEIGYNTKYINIIIKAMSLNDKEKIKFRLYMILEILNTLKIYCDEFLGKGIDSKRFNEKNMKYDKELLIKLLNNNIKF